MLRHGQPRGHAGWRRKHIATNAGERDGLIKVGNGDCRARQVNDVRLQLRPRAAAVQLKNARVIVDDEGQAARELQVAILRHKDVG